MFHPSHHDLWDTVTPVISAATDTCSIVVCSGSCYDAYGNPGVPVPRNVSRFWVTPAALSGAAGTAALEAASAARTASLDYICGDWAVVSQFVPPARAGKLIIAHDKMCEEVAAFTRLFLAASPAGTVRFSDFSLCVAERVLPRILAADETAALKFRVAGTYTNPGAVKCHLAPAPDFDGVMRDFDALRRLASEGEVNIKTLNGTRAIAPFATLPAWAAVLITAMIPCLDGQPYRGEIEHPMLVVARPPSLRGAVIVLFGAHYSEIVTIPGARKNADRLIRELKECGLVSESVELRRLLDAAIAVGAPLEELDRIASNGGTTLLMNTTPSQN